MEKKSRKYKTYSVEVRKEAVRLHIEEKWTYRQITEYFEIQDKESC